MSNPVSRSFDDGSSVFPPSAILIAVVCCVLFALAWRRRTGALHELSAHLKTTHFLPFTLQCVIFFYWSLYWRELPEYLPQIGLQIAFAYGLDALVSLVRKRGYTLTAGPLPIVGSTNLFIQFPASDWPMQYAAIAIAILSKSLLSGERKHRINPSALGICVVGAISLALPRLGNGDIAHVFNLPPNMAELILILGLVVQTRIPVVMTSIGCLLGLWIHALASPHHNFSPLWSPVTLVIVLLITDPATSPRTGLGRLFFGGLFGVLAGLCGELLTAAGLSDFYGKILPLPLCNWLVPGLDAIARGVGSRARRWTSWADPRFNLAHVAVFVALLGGGLAWNGKPAALLGIGHSYNDTRFVRWNTDGTANCPENRLFCDGFTFVAEGRCWVADYVAGLPRCGGGTPRIPRR